MSPEPIYYPISAECEPWCNKNMLLSVTRARERAPVIAKAWHSVNYIIGILQLDLTVRCPFASGNRSE